MEIEVKELSCGYKKVILENVSFSLKDGAVCALAGDNGSGKSTLLKTLCGAILPLNGEVIIDGKKNDFSSVAYVPQGNSRPMPLDCIDSVLLGRARHIGRFTVPGDKDKDMAQAALDRLGVGKLAHTPCTMVSGGELRLVNIARALVSESKILILDEPESSLDSKNRRLICETLTALAADGMIIIYSSHFIKNILRTATNVIYVENGRAEFLPPENIADKMTDY